VNSSKEVVAAAAGDHVLVEPQCLPWFGRERIRVDPGLRYGVFDEADRTQ
jgi:hypothetical protein